MRFNSEQPEALSDIKLDIAIGCLGYESRSTYIPNIFFRHATRKIALGFSHNQVLNYGRNLEYFRSEGYSVFPNVPDESFELTISTAMFGELVSLTSSSTIGVDISCFDRFRLAAIVALLWGKVSSKEVAEVIFFYNVARFSRPHDKFSVNVRLEPVHPSFVGTRPDPLSSITAVIGLGHEREKAVGAAEYLEANEVFAFHPRSRIAEYYDSVQKANALLLTQLNNRHHLDYNVEDCAALVADLSSLIRGIVTESSAILIPLGPKVFALASLLTAKLHPRASVWRMSQMGTGDINDQLPSESYSVLRMRA